MQVLKEISQVSNYRPKNGLKKELYELTVVKGYDRVEAERLFEAGHKKGHFSIVFKKLKYRLLDGILNISSKIPANQMARMRVWIRHLQIKMLLAVGKKNTGIKLAIQAVNNAEREGEFLTVLSYSRILIFQYSGNNFDSLKYQKYKDKYDKALKNIHEEYKVIGYYTDLQFNIKTKRPLNHVPNQIVELNQISKVNQNYRFRQFFYIFKSLFYRTVGEQANFLENNQAAIHFFNNQAKDLPYQVKFDFLIELVPTYILHGLHQKAASTISQSLDIVPTYEQNWHRVLIYQAILGIWSNKPNVALSAYKIAHSVPRQFNSNAIDENWHLLKGYLMVYAKLGIIPPVQKPFRIKSWVNVVDKRGDDATKANRLIIEALYYLADKKRATFFETTEKIGHSMNKRFKEHRFSRTRVFFRALKCITKGNYHPVLTTAHAKRYIKQLRDTNHITDSKRLEVEMVGYLDLWELVLNNLKK